MTHIWRRMHTALLSLCITALSTPMLAAESDPVTALQALEHAAGGRLGVYVLDTGDPKRSFGLNADQRFGMCSTFKLLLAGVVLREAEAGRLDLNQSIHFGPEDMVPHAPVTEKYLDKGAMTILELAQATQTTSDNPAANLLLRRLGGTDAFTEQLRQLGDATTRLDRVEPAMNLVPSGESRDTTTPQAMAQSVAALLLGDALRPGSQQRLKEWMIATRTGLARIRAGLPEDWTAGDKTGTGIAPSMPNKYNDVAVIWPPHRAPIVVAAYFEADGHYPQMRDQDVAVLAEVGRIVTRSVETTP